MRQIQHIRNIVYGLGGLVIASGLAFPAITSAATVHDDFEMPINSEYGTADSDGLTAHNRDAQMTGQLEKTVRLRNQNQNIDSTAQESVSTGETLTVEELDTTGNWILTGSFVDHPLMDKSVEKRRDTRLDKIEAVDYTNITAHSVYFPMDREAMQVTSSNPEVITCNSMSCEAKSAGEAIITVSFPSNEQDIQIQRPIFDFSSLFDFSSWQNRGKSGTGSDGSLLQSGPLGDIRTTDVDTQSFYPNGANTGYGVVAASVQSIGTRYSTIRDIDRLPPDNQLHAYNFDDITYDIEVTEPNNPPEADYKDTTNITKSKATAKWSYDDDPDGDPHDKSLLQIAKDDSFASSDIEVNRAISEDPTGGIITERITGLNPDTTYYPRVKVFDDRSENNESQWDVGEAFETDADPTPAPELTSFTINGQSNQLTVTPGDELNVAWETKHANRFANCNAGTNPWTSGYFWTGNKSVSDDSETGSAPAPNFDITYEHTLTCTPKDAHEPIQSAQVDVTVDVNEAPDVTYDETTDIQRTQATANWLYDDAEGDTQASYELHVSKDGTFGNGDDLVFDGSNTTKTHVLTGLESGTEYTPRVRATDSFGKQSDWSVGQPFETEEDTRPEITGCEVIPKTVVRGEEARIKVDVSGNNGDPANYGYRLNPNINDDIKSTQPESGFADDPNDDGEYTWMQDYVDTPVGRKKPEVTVKNQTTDQTRTKECPSLTYFPSRDLQEVNP